MRAHKLAVLLCALAIASTPLAALASGAHADAPHAAAVNGLSGQDAYDSPDAATASEAPVAGSAATTQVDFSLTKIIAAPFRGLARLFGGGKKEPPQSAKDEARQPAGTAQTAADVTKQPAASEATPQPATPASMMPEATMPEAATTHAYAPAAPPIAPPFTPLIIGVPNDPISQGRALIGRGLFEEAISELSVAAATGTNLVEANNLLGLAYDHRGEHRRAQSYYERALALAPKDARVVSNLGYSLYLDDRYPEALSKLKMAVRLDPSSGEIYNNLGFVYGRLKKYDEAFRSFAQAGGDLYARLRTAQILEDAGRDRDAIKHYEAARKLDPASTEVLRRLITLYNRTGQRDKAEAAERFLDKPKDKTTTSTT